MKQYTEQNLLNYIVGEIESVDGALIVRANQDIEQRIHYDFGSAQPQLFGCDVLIDIELLNCNSKTLMEIFNKKMIYGDYAIMLEMHSANYSSDISTLSYKCWSN